MFTTHLSFAASRPGSLIWGETPGSRALHYFFSVIYPCRESQNVDWLIGRIGFWLASLYQIIHNACMMVEASVRGSHSC